MTKKVLEKEGYPRGQRQEPGWDVTWGSASSSELTLSRNTCHLWAPCRHLPAGFRIAAKSLLCVSHSSPSQWELQSTSVGLPACSFVGLWIGWAAPEELHPTSCRSWDPGLWAWGWDGWDSWGSWEEVSAFQVNRCESLGPENRLW